jgi:hypothetical protein
MASGTLELESFVRESLLRGANRGEIERAMIDAGWSSDQARSALGAFADVPFSVPVPKPRPYVSAKEAFIYLVLFTTLYLSAYHFGSLLFDFINRAFPDAGERGPSNLVDDMRWSVASLFIAFPVFLYMSGLVARALVKDPVKRLSPIRRWLTYLTLFTAAGFLIGDMTTLVYQLLGGELTVRFMLKVIVVGAIAGTVFGYYLHDLRREEVE